MNQHIQNHLTEAQLDDHLIGDTSAEIKAHLDFCALCSTRLSSALAPIAGFGAATLAWGERRSATMPMQRFSSRELTWNQRLAWTASMAAAITVGFAVPLATNQATNQARMERDQTIAASTSVASNSSRNAQPDDQIASDNRMLQAIDDQFAAASDERAALGLVSAARTRSVTPSSMQD